MYPQPIGGGSTAGNSLRVLIPVVVLRRYARGDHPEPIVA